MGEVTRLLALAREGDNDARRDLFGTVYAELRQIAVRKLSHQGPLTNIDAPALVHEAYLRLVETDLRPASRQDFLAYAASVMRSVIVDYARERNALKRGSGIGPITLQTRDGIGPQKDPDVEALDLAMQELAQVDPRCHQIVELRYFGGLSIEEIADAMELSPATVKRDWQKARAFLFDSLQS